MQTLAIDIETFSSTDLKKSGVYKYAEAHDFTILLLAFSFDSDKVRVLDLAKNPEDFEIIKPALTDPTILKTAFNANFERTCLSAYSGLSLPPDQWECTMVKGAMLGLPMSLDGVAKTLRLEEQKDNAGKALIRYFSMPCKPTKTNGMRERNTPQDSPDKWESFKNYCVQDVVTELAIREKISFFEIPDTEKKLWQLDQKMNDSGVRIDLELVRQAIEMDAINRSRLTDEAISLTGLDNPNSAAQLKEWLSSATDSSVTSLTKKDIPSLLANGYGDNISRVLNIRQEMAKTSVKKYTAMINGLCADGRLRGLLQFVGANRTGRWAGRLVQVQNLPKSDLKDLDLARIVVRSGDTDMVRMLFGNIPDTLSQLIRTAFIPSEDHKLIVSDFSAIEARVIAWLSGEKWRMEVFRTHGKIYEASASHMFKVPLESISYISRSGEVIKGVNYGLRAKGKVAELALGYQGGPGALIKMGALEMGLLEEELPRLVAMWRNANKNIVRLWSVVGDAAIAAVRENKPVRAMLGLRFFVEKNILFIELPSGRRLSYFHPRLKINKFGNEALCYEGMDQSTKVWGMQETYGGKLVENIVQAIARDCLAEALLKVDRAGYKICMHVHDEIVIETPSAAACVEDLNSILREPIPWAKGLLLSAEGFESAYYKKD